MCTGPRNKQLSVLRDSLIVVAKIRLARIVAEPGMERTTVQIRGHTPSEAAIVGELVRDFCKVAAGRSPLIVVENINAPRVGIDRRPGKPLRSISARSAIQEHRWRERRSPVNAPLKCDIGAVTVVVIGVDQINVSRSRLTRTIDSERRKIVDSVVSKNLIHCEEIRRGV